MVKVVYTKAQQQMIEDGLPEIFCLPVEERRKLWEKAPLPSVSPPKDWKAEAARRQLERNQRKYQEKKNIEIQRKLRKQAEHKPFDPTGLRWNQRKGKWEPDPFYNPQEDNMKLIVTPYDVNGLALIRGKTSLKEDATAEEITAKVQYAFLRAGKKTVKVEITKDGQIVDTRAVTEQDFAAAASAAETSADQPDAEENENMAKNGKSTKTRKAKKPRAPGVIAAIIEAMSRASGVSLEETVAILTKKFPERKTKSMTSTAKIQLSKNAKSKEKNEKRGLVYYR